MLIGDPSSFAIESGVSIAYEEPGALALGYFVIHIDGRSYGVREPDATWLACSFSRVGEIINGRGKLLTPFTAEADAGKIADAFGDFHYAPVHDEIDAQILEGISKECAWAPDGDEAFDDGSHVLYFHVGKRVRLIGFRSIADGYHHDPATLRDVWFEADKFYGILQTWRDAFEKEWITAAKPFKAGDNSEAHIAEVIRLAKLTETIRQSGCDTTN